jgi:cellulose synthase/poly-beta-1,6-N-acetylglucosamine synthase-like glycosyltransferase
MNFNGTTGVWRKSCIEEAGGWEVDTLTEDLDLSYRAQLAGWKFQYVPGVEVPAELPVDMNGFRGQQFRWTKGAVQTAVKLLPALWFSCQPIRVKIQGTLHLSAHLVFPFILVVATLHVPLVLLDNAGEGPGSAFFAAMSVGLVGFFGFFLAQVLAQRSLYPDWRRRLRILPLFLAGSMGLALNNSKAVFEALIGRTSPFVRTPKYRSVGSAREKWWASGYVQARLPAIVWVELAMLVYTVAGAVYAIATARWAMVPFQLLFVVGFGLVTAYNFLHFVQVRVRR